MIPLKLLLIIFSCFYGVNGEASDGLRSGCWIWGACKADEANHKKLRSCYDPIPDPEKAERMKEASASGIYDFTTDVDVFLQKFCKEDNELQEKITVEVGQLGLEKYSEYCASPWTRDKCETYHKVMSCMLDCIDDFTKKGLC
ncbi:uncharacterized protein [Parasteatoda tepidariorum]|uniref:uncharacterized protein n=1 Tax=Parasteatoda tepidariorum TaxID=114398 RepID=UPI00077F9FB5|nr:uncharacterized protein LOC107452863 [Parasteatoda tepidariorum]